MIHGWGVNNANYTVHPAINGKRSVCPFYRTWSSMLCRCYSSKYHSKATYINCQVDEQWRYFMTFREWAERQYGHDFDGWQLDKDFLSPNMPGKIYSPETCCFVSSQINSLLVDHRSRRGHWPQGVRFHKQVQRFCSALRVNGSRKHLGYFNTPSEAFRAYVWAKTNYALKVLAKLEHPQQKAIEDSAIRYLKSLVNQAKLGDLTPCLN